MNNLSSFDLTHFFLAISILLIFTRLFGAVMVRFKKPAVVGEIMGGVVLGPTVFGSFFPETFNILFPTSGPLANSWQALINISVILFIFTSGLELEFSRMKQYGKASLTVGLFGFCIPFMLGVAFVLMVPSVVELSPLNQKLPLALYLGVILSISALPVIIKTLSDLKILKTPVATTTIGAAIFDDLIGWIIFAIVLTLSGQTLENKLNIYSTIIVLVSYIVFMLFVGRKMIKRGLSLIRNWGFDDVTSYSVILALIFLSAAITEWLGIHAMFGALIVGIILSDTDHLEKKTSIFLNKFIAAFFSPIFFGFIGLRADFGLSFDLKLFLIIFILSCLAKIVGVTLGALLSGFKMAEALAISFAMNARGAMGIIITNLGLQAGLINNQLFSAFILMALITSIISGPLIQFSLSKKKV